MSISTATQIYSPENICDLFIHVNGSCFCDYCNPSCSLQPTPSHTAPILRQPASNFYLKMQSNPYYSTELHEAINDINEALENEYYPMLIEDCSGGVYLCTNLHDDNEAIFKPKDEEPFCINNPKHYLKDRVRSSSSSLREGIPPGESYIREYFAYIVDHDHWASVPATVIATMSSTSFRINDENGNKINSNDELYTKEGSLQLFIENQGSADNYGVCKFNYKDIHHIGILDIRLLNLDRHENNLLTQTHKKPSNSRRSYSFSYYDRPSESPPSSLNNGIIHLIPIDHGYTIPSIFTLSIPEWSWYSWEQSYLPFSESDKEYIRSLDIQSDLDFINKKYPFENEYVLTLLVQQLWIQLCIECNFNLHQIASIYINTIPEDSSVSIFMSIIRRVLNEVQDLNDHSFFLDHCKCYFEREIQAILNKKMN